MEGVLTGESNISLPMLFTLLGIVKELKDEHFEKAQSPMLLTLVGMVTDFRDEQL